MKHQTQLPCLTLFSAVFLLALVLCVGWVYAVPHTATKRHVTPLQDHRAGAMQARLSAAEKAAHWGLTEQEWHRYEAIMAGPRGIWSPAIDPISALGLSAEDPARRRDYAERLLALEKARVEAELAFNQTLREVQQEKYSHLDYLDRDKLRTLIAKRVANQRALTDLVHGDRVLLFIRLHDCVRCVSQANYWLERIKSNAALALDIYALDAPDDATLREWARKLNLNIDLIRSKRVTLNHDRGTLWRVSGDVTMVLRVPVVIRQRGADLVMLDGS